jgi:hypothetical protein
VLLIETPARGEKLASASPTSTRTGHQRSAHEASKTPYPQQTFLLTAGSADSVGQPQPVPPLDFTSASCAQQAFTPAGAGPPQQPAACFFLDSLDATGV